MPVQGRKRQGLTAALSILIIISLDQYLKFLVRTRLIVGESIPVIKNILHITFVTNTGAAFGLFKNAALVFMLISLTAISAILVIVLKEIRSGRFFKKRVLNFGLILIASGAAGNLIDRIRFGYVVDFIDVRMWPVFNLSDAVITIGTFLLITKFICARRLFDKA